MVLINSGEQYEILLEMLMSRCLPAHTKPLVTDLLIDGINANFVEERLLQLEKRIPDLVLKFRDTL